MESVAEPVAEPNPYSAPAPARSGGSRFRSAPSGKRRRRRVLIVVGCCVLAAAIVAAGVLGYGWYRHDQERKQVAERIGEVVSSLQTCDDVIIPLDAAISSEIDGEEDTELVELMDAYDATVEELDAAQAQIDDLRSGEVELGEDEDAILTNLSTSISSRKDMLAVGQELLEVDTALSTARPLMQTAMDKLVEANDTVLESVEAANEYAKSLAGEKSSQTDPQVPVDLDNEALTLLTEASEAVGAAQEAFPAADYTAYQTYIEAKVAAVNLLLEIDEAIAAGTYNAAAGKVAAYNEADAAATEAAASLPETADDLLKGAYVEATAEQRDAYNEARQAAAEADTAVREYAGVDMGISERAEDE